MAAATDPPSSTKARPEPVIDQRAADTELVRSWLEANIGGTVTSIRRQPRWRPVWFADVTVDGELHELVVRGDRTDMPLIFPLEHEMTLQSLLHERGIPTPAVRGWIDEPMAYVMDRVGGQQDFTGCTDAQRASAVDDYLQILARMHTLDIEPFAAAGIMRAGTPQQSASLGLARYEEVFRSTKNGPDPFMEFCLGWLRRNPPLSLGRESVIAWDSGQFHQADGRIVAVLDLEIGHIGDPMMDLAAWRMRDTIVGYGDFPTLYARYEELTGTSVDVDALMRHHFAFTLTNQLALGQAVRQPNADTDLMTNMQWCYETNLFATEALAEILDIELPDVEQPASHQGRASTPVEHMATVLRSLSVGDGAVDDEFLRYRLRALFREARHAARAIEVGDSVSADDLDDLYELLGRRPDNWFEGESELERFVLADAATGTFDETLLILFHKRNLRAHQLLGPAGSAMATHLPIQTFR
jgi:aminoglycoside phosphotransferase (APT) family kinase protein